MKIPRVISAGTVRCIDSFCSSDTIEITVQPSLMESVRKQSPSSVNGVPTVLALNKQSDVIKRDGGMAIRLEEVGEGVRRNWRRRNR
jgi:hypothetical protein